MKTVAIFFSDLHLGEYAKFNKNDMRTLSHFKVLSVIKEACLKHNCPAIFAGDLFHRPEVMSNQFYKILVKQFKKLDKHPWDLYAISGNHDCSLRNTLEKSSPSWVKSLSEQFKFLKCIDFKTIELGIKGKIYHIHGIPYLEHNVGLNIALNKIKEKWRTILILHTDYPGAKDTDNSEVGTVENININLISKFALTIIGHIHKPQRLAKKVYMVGAPLQQRRTDKNCDMGYWELKEDLSMKFVNLSDKFPKFIDVDSQEDIKEDGNYYTVISKDMETTEATNHGINKSLSSSRLVRKYLKFKNVKDKNRKQLLIKLLKESQDDTI